MDKKVEFALKFIEGNLMRYKRIATPNSFGKDSIVLQHLVNQIDPDILVLWIKPPFLPKETVQFANKVIKEWKLNVKVLTSTREKYKGWMKQIVYEPKLWKTNPELCCQVFKVAPIMKAVRELNLEAWFSGMRKSESEKRNMYTHVWEQGSFTKLHPILNFTEADIWRYTAVHKLPVHPWYALGYRSLGCEPCSFPNVWNSERGGRWHDTLMEGGDCGIHCTPMKE